MKSYIIAAGMVASMATAVFADGHATGDAGAGEKAFKKCKSCHMIVSNDGSVIQKGSKTGPNLYGINGRIHGVQEKFRYSKGLAAMGEQGVVWDEAKFVAWTKDPSKYLKASLGKTSRSKMSYKLKSEEDALNIWAYLVSVGPDS
jgi:cytochrome c